MKLFPITNYSDFYGRPLPEDPFALIRQYPTDVVLLFLCKANAAMFQADQDTMEGRFEVFKKVFFALSLDKRVRVGKLLLEEKKDGNPEYRVLFNKQSLAWLIAECFRFYKPMNDYQNATETEVHDNVFDAVLIANDIYYNNTEKYQPATYEHTWEIMLRQQNYVRDLISMIQNGSLKMLFFRQFIEQQFPEGKNWVEEFCKSLNIKNYFAYSAFFMDIIGRVFTDYKRDGEIRWHIEPSPETQVMIDRFANRPADFLNGEAIETLHGGMIPKPIYFAMDKFAVILDFNFLAWLIETALPYNFYAFTSIGKDPAIPNFSAFKGILGKSFYEEFLGERLITKLFPHATCLPDKSINGLTDLMIIQGADIFIFEFKSAALNYKVLDKIDVEGFREFIDKNFLAEKKKDGKNRGIHQVVNSINAIAAGNETRLTAVLKQGRKYSVYPIVVYYDPVLENHGVNAYCNDRFVPAVDNYRSSFRHIYPITMINLDFFMMHYDLLQGKTALLKKWIKEYHQRSASNLKSFKKSEMPLTFLNACVSFDHYVQGFLERDTESVRRIAEDFDLPNK